MIFRKSHAPDTSMQAGFSSRQLLLDRLVELNSELSDVTSECEELQRLLNQFEASYHSRLGKHISRILDLRRQRAGLLAQEDTSFGNRYQEAVEDYDAWHNASSEITRKKIFSLSEDDTKLLKQTFRKAARKCHPDVTRSKDKEKAEQLFVSLRQAYERNDLEAVLSLAENIDSEEIIEQDLAQAEIDSIKKSIEVLEQLIEKQNIELKNLTASDSYQILSVYPDPDHYFEEKERELKQQADELMQGMGVAHDD